MTTSVSTPAPQIDELLRAVDADPTAASYARAAREIAADPSALEPVRVALLGSFTIAPLVPYLKVEAARRGFHAACHVGPFNSIIQELVDPTSGCAAFGPDAIFLALLLEDAAPDVVFDFLSLTAAEVEAAIERTLSDLRRGIAAFRQRWEAAVILQGFALPPGLVRELCEGPDSLAAVVARANAAMAVMAGSLSSVYVLDYERVIAEVGVRRWRDERMWYLGRAPLSAHALPALARRQAGFIHALRRPARKCLVLDLDNTLWGGVLGEAGPTGIQLGSDYPGNVFRDVQRLIKQLHRRGLLLALNSKNNAEDVREVFETHPAMLLRLDDFSAVRINWEDKVANLLSIAEELNLGADSFVFVDDSPIERERMRQALPDVLTVELPPGPIGYRQALLETGAFERVALTTEDRHRNRMYGADVLRRRLQSSTLTLDDFLNGLEMRASIEPVTDRSLQRAVDLLHKTNQFNLTTQRHSAALVAARAADPAWGVFTVRVVDRYGDNGIVGLAMVEAAETRATIDSFLLSCRVIGRRIETALLAHVTRWARARGLSEIVGRFVPTAKNKPAADFFGRHGFERMPQEDDSYWQLSLSADEVAWPTCLREDG